MNFKSVVCGVNSGHKCIFKEILNICVVINFQALVMSINLKYRIQIRYLIDLT